jgi:dTDP-4-dehydrorhamnose reductase
MKVLVLGYGMLGKELVKQTGWDYTCIEEQGFDITKPEKWSQYLLSVEFGSIQHCPYDVIINCIANTDTYSEERGPHWDINYRGTSDLVDFCNKWKVKLVQISTDYVYAGGMPNQSEDDVPVHQDTWYSYTKLLSDAHVQLKSEDYLLLRLGHKQKPFPHPKAFSDIYGNFDYTDKITSIIVKMVKNNISGLYNVGTEAKSMYDLAKQTNPDVLPTSQLVNHIPKCVLMDLKKFKKLSL